MTRTHFMNIQVPQRLQSISRGFACVVVLLLVLLQTAKDTDGFVMVTTYELVEADGDEERNDKEQEEDERLEEKREVISMHSTSSLYGYSYLEIRVSIPLDLRAIIQDIPSPPPDIA